MNSTPFHAAHRAFSSTLLLAAAGLVLGATAAAQHSPGSWRAPLPNAVAAGDVDQDSAVLWARTPRRGLVFFQVSTRRNFLGDTVTLLQPVWDPRQPAKVQVRGLRSGKRYYYRAIQGLRSLSAGTFKTPAAPGKRRGVRFGVSGDQRGDIAPFPAVRNVPARNLDLFVELGDTIYADVASPNLPQSQAKTLLDYRIKHEEVYAARLGLNTLAELRSSTALLAMIDDHEVTNDFAGGADPKTDPRFPATSEKFINETELYRNGLGVFHEYNPIQSLRYGNTGDPRTAAKPKLYRVRRYGDDAVVILLDARSFRDAELVPADPRDAKDVARFLAQSFDPTRTMLGAAQLADLLKDLEAAQKDGVLWKFVMVPEPIQNLGVFAASDRFEGYAAERNKLLGFITDKGITNVVFVSADIHGTLVNNLTYQTSPTGPQLPTTAFEISTGAIAYDKPLGPTLVEQAAALGLITPAQKALYESLPTAAKDAFVESFANASIAPFGYDPLGLDGSSIQAKLVVGERYTSVHAYSWTEFEIEAKSGKLTVTNWGIAAYDADDLKNDPKSVIGRVPAVVHRFEVTPK